MKIKAIIIGNLVDVVGSILGSLALGLLSIFAAKVFHQGTAFGRLPLYLADSELSKPLRYIVGGLFSILGGYVCASLARERELIYGGLSTLLCLGLGTLQMLSGFKLTHLGAEFLTLGLGVFGGFLRYKKMN